MFLSEKKLRRVMQLLTRCRFLPKERRYLNKQYVARLATVSGNTPHVAPVCFAFKSAKIYIATERDSKKIRNIVKNNKVALVVDDYVSWGDVRGVLIEGEAEILESGKNYEFGERLIHEKYKLTKSYRFEAGKHRVIIAITPKKIASWRL